MQRLDCHVKEYAWGKCGEQSEVARLFSAGHQSFKIGSKTPYAELWMGTHPDGPATIRGTSECLSKAIARASEGDLASYFCGNGEKRKEEIHLPFIMKIMSIKHTLSLQVHPTKEQAAVLHRQDPLHYPDRNHKPELAYALTRFELLCGFRPAEEIIINMKAFPELRKIMGEKNAEKFICCYHSLKTDNSVSPSDSPELKAHLRICFETMLQMQVDRPIFVEEQLRSLYARIDMNVRGCLIEDTIAVMRDTYKRFPSDVGCFAPLYVNHMILHPGECCYYAAEELHAYLSGECVECVGCSNNTIRAALTPKFIDHENLVRVLNYRMTDPKFYIVEPRPLEHDERIVEFAPADCEDFTLHEIQVLSETKNYVVELPALDCPSIIVIVEGEASCHELPLDNISTVSDSEVMQSLDNTTSFKRGDIFYIPPQQSLSLNANSLRGDRFLAYRTFSYEIGPDHANRIIIPKSVDTTMHQESPLIIDNSNGKYTNGVHKNGTCKISPFLNKSLEIPTIEQLKLSQKMNAANGKFDQIPALFVVESEMDGFL